VAADGAEAFELIKNNSGKKFNVIFVDWKVPDMDGIELARKLKEKHESGVVVIMISAAQWNDVESEAKEAGVSRFLSKPLFSSEIMDCITECLTSSRLCVKPVKPEESEEGCFAGYNVLLAEDVDINREIVESLLEHTGVKIYNAENGQQAFDMFRRQPGFYDMIFMDIHMPEMDGYEATQRIRSLGVPEAATVPIVAMTANVFKEDVNRCLSIGMNSHIGKPINVDEIIVKMKMFLRQKSRSFSMPEKPDAV
jgi:FOG: CheY-like receiver